MENNTKEDIGCCGAFCGTCKVKKEKLCIGCKIGYVNGERDISKAKCKMKICCISKQFVSCADCKELNSCSIIQEFYNKNGYKYKKYKQAIDYIQSNGYLLFLKQTKKWTMQYGKYEEEKT